VFEDSVEHGASRRALGQLKSSFAI
jgi:hypothetical protein